MPPRQLITGSQPASREISASGCSLRTGRTHTPRSCQPAGASRRHPLQSASDCSKIVGQSAVETQSFVFRHGHHGGSLGASIRRGPRPVGVVHGSSRCEGTKQRDRGKEEGKNLKVFSIRLWRHVFTVPKARKTGEIGTLETCRHNWMEQSLNCHGRGGNLYSSRKVAFNVGLSNSVVSKSRLSML